MSHAPTPTLKEALASAAACLEGKVENPQTESELLAGAALDLSRSDIYKDLSIPIAQEDFDRVVAMAGKRAKMQPLQYITGVQAFRKLELLVGPGVLVPRPETEMVVQRCLDLLASVEHPLVADLGTGSGAIALAVATERPDSRVWATELSDAAFGWARRNLGRYRASNVMLRSGDLFRPLPARLQGAFDVIVSNPPYLSESELAAAPADVRHEPREALVAGDGGLEVAARIVEASPRWLKPGGWLVLETSPGRWERLRTLMAGRFAEVAVTEDLAGRRRVAQGRAPGDRVG